MYDDESHDCWTQCCDRGPHACICGNDCQPDEPVTTPDRARQAKALIRYFKNERDFERSRGGGPVADFADQSIRVIEEWAAALTASEAEVTRLETGIAEALAMGASGERWWEMHEFLSELSQPTTDTNGAHA